MSKFINIKSLNSKQSGEVYDGLTDDQLEELYEHCIEIYQVQATLNSSNVNILKVGVMIEMHDILIKELELLDQYKIYLVSKLYDFDKLKELYTAQIIPMVQGNITYQNEPYGSIFFNFCPSTQSIPDELINIQGYFSITFHFKDDDQHKYTELIKLDTFCGNTNMINKIVEYTLKELI